jgi:hypothetical protein
MAKYNHKMDEAYGISAPLINIFPSPIVANRAPTNLDQGEVGQIWVDEVGGSTYILQSKAAGVFTWTVSVVGVNLSVAGSVTAGTNLVATAGSVTAGTSVAAGTTVTAGTGITSTTGNITASAGNIVATAGSVSAGTTVSATTTVTGGTGVIATTGNVTASAGAVIAATTVTATLGAITATNGDVILNTTGKTLRIKTGGAADMIGTATLALGTIHVVNASVSVNSKIMCVHAAINASTAIGVLHVIAGAGSFDVTALNATATTEVGDLSDVIYFIVNPA